MKKPDNKREYSLLEIEQGELTHRSGRNVPFSVVHGWDPRESAQCDSLWKAAWLELFEQITEAEADPEKQAEIIDTINIEDFHWRWFEKAINFSTHEYEWFHLYADSKPQATCVIYHPNPSALEPGDIFYVKYVAVAPWNRSCKLRPREFGGVGKVILRAAQRFAVTKLNLRPGFCLHSLPKAEGFYHKINMIKVDGKEDEQSLAYFELPQGLATELMEAK